MLLEDKENSDFLMFDSQISLLTSDEIDMISGSGAGDAVAAGAIAGAVAGFSAGGVVGAAVGAIAVGTIAYGGYEIGEWLDS